MGFFCDTAARALLIDCRSGGGGLPDASLSLQFGGGFR
jgi:hypothetical protein